MNDDVKQKMHLMTSTEGKIFVVGVVFFLLYVIWLALMCIVSPGDFQKIVGVTATHVLFGRAAGISFSYAIALSHGMVVSINMLIETILVLLFYPLFVFSWQHLLSVGVLQRGMDAIHSAAETHQHTIKRYGVVGLFLFVWLPFWMTGPLVGCVVGYVLGFHPWLVLAVVLSGTYCAIGVWTFLLSGLHAHIVQYSPYAPIALVVILVVIVIIGTLLHRDHHG